MNVLSRTWSLFGSRERLQITGILILMLVGALFELLGIGLMLPFVGLLADPASLWSTPIMSDLLRFFSVHTQSGALVFLGTLMITAFVVKNGYLAGFIYVQNRFIFTKQIEISNRLLWAYLKEPYLFHLQKNSSELLRNLTTETNGLINGVLNSMMTLGTEISVFSMIVAFLVYKEPLAGGITLLFLGGSIALIHRTMNQKIEKLGNLSQYFNAKKIQWINQALSGIKEIKIIGNEQFFVDSFDKQSREYAGAARIYSTVNKMPRLLIEVLVLSGVVLITLVMLAQGNELKQTLPVLGLFAMAAFRLMPSIVRIVSMVNDIQFFTPSLKVISDDLHSREKTNVSDDMEPAVFGKCTFSKSIEIKGVGYKYPNSSQWALRDLTFKVTKGESVAFVGPSGSGKTTLADVVMGLLRATSGDVSVDGSSIWKDLRAWQRHIAYVPQNVYLIDDTISRNIALGIPDAQIDRNRLERAIDMAQLRDFVQDLPAGPQTIVGERGARISGGQKQRIAVARALYYAPDVLVLDEATSALDSETEAEITRAIEGLHGEITILVIAHRLSTVRNCDRLLFLDQGILADAGTFSDLVERNPKFRSLVQHA